MWLKLFPTSRIIHLSNIEISWSVKSVPVINHVSVRLKITYFKQNMHLLHIGWANWTIHVVTIKLGRKWFSLYYRDPLFTQCKATVSWEWAAVVQTPAYLIHFFFVVCCFSPARVKLGGHEIYIITKDIRCPDFRFFTLLTLLFTSTLFLMNLLSSLKLVSILVVIAKSVFHSTNWSFMGQVVIQHSIDNREKCVVRNDMSCLQCFGISLL